MSPERNNFREFAPLLFLDSRFVNYLKNDTKNASILNVLSTLSVVIPLCLFLNIKLHIIQSVLCWLNYM
jgi:hypothetical protein